MPPSSSPNAKSSWVALAKSPAAKNAMWHAGRVVAYPFERIWLLNQQHAALARSGGVPSQGVGGAWDGLFAILQREDVAGLWHGGFLALLRTIGEKQLTARFLGLAQQRVSAPQFALHGLASGLAQATLHPVTHAQQALACDLAKKRKYLFGSGFSALVAAVKRGGLVNGLYRGLPLGVAHAAVHSAALSALRHWVQPFASAGGPVRWHVISFLTAVAVTAVTYPLDVVARRQLATVLDKDRSDQSALGCASEILDEEGVAGFFAGLPERVLFLLFSGLSFLGSAAVLKRVATVLDWIAPAPPAALQ